MATLYRVYLSPNDSLEMVTLDAQYPSLRGFLVAAVEGSRETRFNMFNSNR